MNSVFKSPRGFPQGSDGMVSKAAQPSLIDEKNARISE